MPKRFVAIWFRYLKTDWFTIRHPGLHQVPFVLVSPDHGRMIITAANPLVHAQGVDTGTPLADARAIIPSLLHFDDDPGLQLRLLEKIAAWCIRFTPFVAIDPPDGVILDATGCPHLWGGELPYLTAITTRFGKIGYDAQASIADTIGSAWAFARFGEKISILKPGEQINSLLALPAAALRIEPFILEKLEKLGLRQIKTFAGMPRSALRRRFGFSLIQRLDEAFGYREELIEPVQPIEPYQERLHCLEPIVTATGIEIALKKLLHLLCHRLEKEQKGIRKACLKAFRMDGKVVSIETGTNHPSNNREHLFKLFEIKISTLEPASGIELFVLEASKVEDVLPIQEAFWESSCNLENVKLAELLDRLSCKLGSQTIHRYLPREHYWPERSFQTTLSLTEKSAASWRPEKLRPVRLLPAPEPVQVTAPVPDYPPMLFRYKNRLHKIIKADGPERIESEWWLEPGPHRDYYCVEDDEGSRYWLFRLGHYEPRKKDQWFIHGFFA